MAFILICLEVVVDLERFGYTAGIATVHMLGREYALDGSATSSTNQNANIRNNLKERNIYSNITQAWQ